MQLTYNESKQLQLTDPRWYHVGSFLMIQMPPFMYRGMGLKSTVLFANIIIISIYIYKKYKKSDMLYAKLSLHRDFTPCRDERQKTKWEQKHDVLLAAVNRKLFLGSLAGNLQMTPYWSLSKDMLPTVFYFLKIEKEQQRKCYKGIFGILLVLYFSSLSCVQVLTTVFKQLRFCCSRIICVVQCSVSTKGSLF